MIFICDPEGTITASIPKPVYQGSAGASTVLLLAPFAATDVVTVGFTLPNGILLQPKLTTSGTPDNSMTYLPLENVEWTDGDGNTRLLNAWYARLTGDVTRYSGTVTAQFRIYRGVDLNEQITTSPVKFDVQKGVARLDGALFDASTATQVQKALNEVLNALAAKQEEIDLLTERMGSAESNIDGIYGDIASLRGDTENLPAEINSLTERMENAESGINVAFEDISSLMQTTESLKAEVQTLDDTKLDKSGGTISGDLAITGNLSVAGSTTEQTIEKVSVKDCVIVTNADGTTLITLSGLAIRKGQTDTYGIMYDPASDSVKLGLVKVDENGIYSFESGEGSPVATRADSSDMHNGTFAVWDAKKKRFVTSSVNPSDIADLQRNKLDASVEQFAIYATNSGGDRKMIPYAEGTPAAVSVPVADDQARLYAVTTGEESGDTPLSDLVLANRGYVDASDNKIKEMVSKQGLDIDLLYTLIENTIITLTTVEDAYEARETAGGLPVVDNSPTTVHRIAGDTKTSVNLFDLSLEGGSASVSGMDITTNNNTWTVSGTANASLVDFKTIILPSTLGGKTITFSQSTYFSSFGEAGAVYFVLDRNDGIRIGNTSQNKLTATLDPEYSYSLSIRCGSYVGESFEEETISFMVNEGEEALPYSDYFAGTKSAAFQGIVSYGRNLLKPSKDLTKTIAGVTYQAMQETGTVKVTGTPNVREGTAVFKNIPLPTGTFTMYIPNKMSGVSWYLRNSTTQVASIGASTTNQFVTFTADTKELYSIYVYVEVSVGTIDYTETPMLLYGSVTENFPAFSLYSADGSFHLDTAQFLGKWDYIDADTQALVTATADADFSSVTDADSGSASGADGTTTTGRYYWALCGEGMVAEDFTLSDIITDLPTIEDYQSLAPDESAYLSLDTATRTLILLIPESYGENGGTWVSEHPEVYAVYKSVPTIDPLSCPKTYKVWRNGMETLDTGDTEALLPTVTQTYFEEVSKS